MAAEAPQAPKVLQAPECIDTSLYIEALKQCDFGYVHSPCPDGNMFSYLIHTFINPKMPIIPWIHGTTVVDAKIWEGKTGFIGDVTAPNLLQICQSAKQVVLIDHHHPSLRQAVPKENFTFETITTTFPSKPKNLLMCFAPEDEKTTMCGSMLLFTLLKATTEKTLLKLFRTTTETMTEINLSSHDNEHPAYKQFQKLQELEYAVRVTNANDIGQGWKLSDDEQAYGMALVVHQTEEYLKTLLETKTRADIIAIGKPLLAAKRLMIKTIAESKELVSTHHIPVYLSLEDDKITYYICKAVKLEQDQWVLFTDLTRYLCEQAQTSKDVFAMVLGYYHLLQGTQGPQGMVQQKLTKVSLRLNPTYCSDTLPVARRFGGGGHKPASAFTFHGKHSLPVEWETFSVQEMETRRKMIEVFLQEKKAKEEKAAKEAKEAKGAAAAGVGAAGTAGENAACPAGVVFLTVAAADVKQAPKRQTSTTTTDKAAKHAS